MGGFGRSGNAEGDVMGEQAADLRHEARLMKDDLLAERRHAMAQGRWSDATTALVALAVIASVEVLVAEIEEAKDRLDAMRGEGG